jgi:Gram-negative bacterial TonB protein C-terminal
MNIKTYHYLIIKVLPIVVVFLSSCASVFHPEGTIINCNGQQVIPLENPSIKASFPGGKNAEFEFLVKNFDYSKGKPKGSVTLVFIITKEGDICDIRITSKSKESLANEVVRILKIMPQWNPASNNGEFVASYRFIKYKFK